MPVPAAATAPAGPAPATRDRAEARAALLPPHAVLLHNDDVNTMDHVVHALLASVPELDRERAMAVMLAAHLQGRAEVIRCPLERAELYRDRLRGFGLTATVERC
jgi:ATP-dependent Clp protease adaptor protein ClpS